MKFYVSNPQRRQIPAQRSSAPDVQTCRHVAALLTSRLRWIPVVMLLLALLTTTKARADERLGTLLLIVEAKHVEVFIDGQNCDCLPPVLLSLSEGKHSIEIRKGHLATVKQVVISAGRLSKLKARLAGP